jgi:hypothetical protein
MMVKVKGEGEQVERAGAAKRGKAVVVERRRRRRSGDIVVVKVKGEGEQVERGGADKRGWSVRRRWSREFRSKRPPGGRPQLLEDDS